MHTRRSFLHQTLLASGGLVLNSISSCTMPKIKISLAEWSLHRSLEGGKIDNLNFPSIAKNKFGIDAVEYVNGFFKTSTKDFKEVAKDATYLNELLARSKDVGVYNHLIMVDNEGSLATPIASERLIAVDNHKKWIDAARHLGCATVRVNLHGEGISEDKLNASVDSLSRLGEYASTAGINVVIENHGSHSSNGKWVTEVMKKVNRSNVGTLPDFGNFCISHPWGQTQDPCENEYDRYTGVMDLLPFAKGVSAKTYDFDVNGLQPKMDYERLISIVKKAGFTGYIGIEFEGNNGDEEEGIRLTKQLLEKYL